MAKCRLSKETEPLDSKRPKSDPHNVEVTASDNVPSYSRDPDYYFEDGSIILLLEDVLFKVHATLLKSHSQVFEDMFTMPAGNVSSRAEGTSDQDPVIIPQVKPSQFRKLLKLIYSPASSAFHESVQARCNSDEGGKDFSEFDLSSWSIFNFYIDVGTLCHRFGMAEMEQWAKRKLQAHISYRTPMLAHGAVANLSSFLDTIKTPGLRENYPSIFGYIFSVFLAASFTVWEDEAFTKLDRMALFSATVRLSPTPDSFRKDIYWPLFEKPFSLEQFRETNALKLFSDGSPCGDQCDSKLMDLWLKAFGDNYYEGVIEASVLAWLPRLRFEFVTEAQEVRCRQSCSVRFTKQLDEDSGLIYVRFGEYYREIE